MEQEIFNLAEFDNLNNASVVDLWAKVAFPAKNSKKYIKDILKMADYKGNFNDIDIIVKSVHKSNGKQYNVPKESALQKSYDELSTTKFINHIPYIP